MIRKFSAIFLMSLMVSGAGTANAAFVLNALTSFGGGDGWLAPAEVTFLRGPAGATEFTASLQRGIAYNATTNQLILADRHTGNFMRVLNGDTGALVNNLNMTGVTGGTLAINMVDVSDDGVIYATNLASPAAGNTPVDHRIYRWADSNPTTEPTVAYSSGTVAPGSGYARLGDSFAVTGSGANTRIVAGSGAVATTPPSIQNGVAVFTTFDGDNFAQATASATSGTPAIPNGAFRLGLDFIDEDTIIGKQTGANFYSADIDPIFGSTSATTFTTGLTNINENLVAFYGPNSLLATVQTNSNVVRLYDASNLSSLSLLSTINLTSAFNTNANAVGDLAFGLGPDGLRLYAMNTNNGVQAFSVTAVPEPGSILLAALFGVGVVARRRFVKSRSKVAA